MDFYDTTSNNPNFNYFQLNTNGTYAVTSTITSGTAFEISDKDWMPYKFFEYIPLWHKKYAAIKYQMEIMWN